ncbi:MAG: 50S ribosomal protein L31e [Candidatus Woesearchaeota archaeon]
MSKLERNYTIPLRRDFVKVPKYRRAKRAISTIKSYLSKHMKSEDVRLGKHLNEYVWQNGIKNPPGKVSVIAIKHDDFVTAEIAGKEYKVEQVQTEVNEQPTGLKGKLQEALKTNNKEEEPKEEDKKAETKTKSEEKNDKKEDK